MPQPAPPSSPDTSRIIWLAIAGGVVLFLAVAALVRWNNPSIAEPSWTRLVWVALLVALGGLAASRALAARGRRANPERARVRMIVQLALCEPGALLGGVAWFLTGNPVSWAAAAIGLLGIALLYPRPLPAGGSRPSPMVR